MSLLFRRFLSTARIIRDVGCKSNILNSAVFVKESNYGLKLQNDILKTTTAFNNINNSSHLSFLTNMNQNIYEPSINKKSIMDLPLIPNPFMNIIIDKKPILDSPTLENTVECPTNPNQEEKQAVRLIVIRRKKMNKHKLKKLRKRQKYKILKIRQRKEIKKEKAFQKLLFEKVQTANAFSPQQYVTEKLHLAKTKPLNRYWKGKKLPMFIIRQLRGVDPKVNYRNYPSTQD